MIPLDSVGTAPWLALVIGNTRLHWGYFRQNTLVGRWHTPHLTAALARDLRQSGFVAHSWQAAISRSKEGTESVLEPLLAKVLPPAPLSMADVWIASAVPEQSDLWSTPDSRAVGSRTASGAQIVERSHIPLSGLYPTLGIDRAINLLGAGELAGWPVLVIDAGTAITLTAGVEQAVYGGAILPGVRLQLEALAQKTAALGELLPAMGQTTAPVALPDRWAKDTPGAIASGLIYGITATLTDYLNSWWQTFPTGKALITGGDAGYLYQCLQQRTPEIASRVLINSDLMFDGMRAYRSAQLPTAVRSNVAKSN